MLSIQARATTTPTVVLAPGHVTTMRLGGLENGLADWIRLAQAGKAAYVWGRLEYLDTFGRPHFTTFQMECRFVEGVQQFSFLKHGNGTDDFPHR